MKLLRLILALFLLAEPASAAMYISGDPTGGANGTSYADMNEWHGDGIDSTYLTLGLDFRSRKFVRISRCTINGNVSLDSLCANVVLDTVKINGNLYFNQCDSNKVNQSTIIGSQIKFGPASFDVAADTLAPDWWTTFDSLVSVRAILTAGYGQPGMQLRGLKSCYFSRVNDSTNCRINNQSSGAKLFTVQTSKFLNSSWRIRNDDDVMNQESGYWCKRDLSSWNQFTQDTIWQSGSKQTNINLSHAGNCGNTNWCNTDRGNTFDQCWFVNLTPLGGVSKVYYQQYAEGDQFTNCVFVSNGTALDLTYGTRETFGLQPMRFRHCTFASLQSGWGVRFPEEPSAIQNLVFTDNVIYSRKQGVTDQYTGAALFNTDYSASVDTMNYNLYFRTYPDSIFWLKGSSVKANPGIGGRFPVLTALDGASFIGSPRFTDSTATFAFNPTPLSTSYAIGSRWRHGYVGALNKAIVDSLPVAPDSIYYASNGTRVRVAFRIPRDDHGVTGWELYRSTTNVESYKDATLFMSDYRISSEPFTQGMEIVTPEVKQKANQTWYWYVVVRDSDGQYSAQTTKAITTTSGGGSWSWPP